MSKELTDQTVTLLYLTPADSRRVNLRFQGIRQVGIYEGMYLTDAGDGSNINLSSGVCEISDGTYQIRVATTSSTTFTPTQADRYIVLTWDYTGDEDDDVVFMDEKVTPDTNDIIIAKSSYSGGVFSFDYGDSSYPRTQPNTLDLHLKVEATDDIERRVRVRAGRIQTSEATVDIEDQKSPLFETCPSNSRIDLVYITSAGLVAIEKGTAAASPSVPDYNGKRVLAEVTLTTDYDNITQSMIKDVREFIGIKQVETPTADYDVANKKYVDASKLIMRTLDAPDFTKNDFTRDSKFHDLNLSSIVPVGTSIVLLKVRAYSVDSPAGGYIAIREKGAESATGSAEVSAVDIGCSRQCFIKLDANRVCEYFVTSHFDGANDEVSVAVLGWIV
ncbi:MAG: hypothetical protein ACTSU7_01880 [Candidatus Heimdallarchaeaceae archaeon]